MRARMALYLVGLGLACQGCAPLWQSARTSLVQPVLYRRNLTDIRECHRNRELAEAAWGTYFSKHPKMEYSEDFECGFKEGFEDFLFWGGTGAPPPVPPRCYWNYKYETPEGQKAAQNWFAGFRAGAESARESGYRKLVLVPASTCLASSTQPPQVPPPSPPAVPGTLPNSASQTEEMLPPPKPVPGQDDPSVPGPQKIERLPPPPAPNSGPDDSVPALKKTNRTSAPSSAPPGTGKISLMPSLQNMPESSALEDNRGLR